MNKPTAAIALPEKHLSLIEAEAEFARLTIEEKAAGTLAEFVAEKLDWTGLTAPDGTPLPTVTKQFVGECFAAHDAAKRGLEIARRRVADENRQYCETAGTSLASAVDTVRQVVLAKLAEIEPAIQALTTLDKDARDAGISALRCLPNTRTAQAALRHLRTVMQSGSNG